LCCAWQTWAHGIHTTADGYLALVMGSTPVPGCEPLLAYTDSATWFTHGDDFKADMTKMAANETPQKGGPCVSRCSSS